MSDKIHENIIIPPEAKGQRLDQILAKLLPDYSRMQIKAWIENGEILLEGQQVKSKYKVKGNEHIVVAANQKPPLAFEPENLPLDIVFEDEAIIVINKPVGLVVHPGAGNTKHTLLNALLYHAPELANLPRAGIVHRLDKNTSGLLVVAKTAKALKSLNKQLKKRTLLREYQAIVAGRMISGGSIEAPIGRHHLHRTRMAVTDTGKEAITHYRILEKYKDHTRLSVKLETGRTHQIRVHLAHIGYPIVGDYIYAPRLKLSKGTTLPLKMFLREFKRQALHAQALGFNHPDTNEPLHFKSELPADMQQLMTKLRE